MKITRLFLISVIVIIVVIAVLTSTFRTPPPLVNNFTQSKTKDESISNSELPYFGGIIEKTNLGVSAEGCFLAATNEMNGTFVAVASDQETITLKDKNGNVVWSKNMVIGFPIDKHGNLILSNVKTKEVGMMPISREQKIRSAYFLNGRLIVYIGKVYLDIDTQTGKIISLQSR